MSWEIKKRLKAVLSTESGAIIKGRGGGAQVALVYPNTYRVGMGNLAIHSLYRMLGARPDIACERAFLPPSREMVEHRRTRTPILTLESQRPLSDFDVIAFSISFENDYLNILPILELARLPYRAEDRNRDMPAIIAGGAAPTLNPHPLSSIFDAIVLGEAECYSDDLLPLIAERLKRTELVDRLSKMDGIVCPSAGGISGLPRPRFAKELDDWRTETAIYSDGAEFGNMHLIELQRGCPFRCSFCATPELYGPPRHRGMAAVMRMVDEGLRHRKKFGLIGAHILSHPDFAFIARAIHARGATFSPSSVRVADIDDERASLLAESGQRSIALGVEAGSEKLRERLGKEIPDDQLMDAVAILARNGITRLRLYFMIGLPGETDDDIRAIAAVSGRVRAMLFEHAPRAARSAGIGLTISPFIPKPGTPFAAEAFAGEDEIKRKIGMLKSLLAGVGGVRIGFDSPLSAALEAYLSGSASDRLAFFEDVNSTDNLRAALRRHVEAGRRPAGRRPAGRRPES